MKADRAGVGGRAGCLQMGRSCGSGLYGGGEGVMNKEPAGRERER